MGLNIRGTYKKNYLPTCPPLLPCSLLPGSSSPGLNNRTMHRSPGLYLLAPAYLIPYCPHLAPYSPGNLEVLHLCVFAYVIPLPRRPLLLVVFLNNLPWVLPGRVEHSKHRERQWRRIPPRSQMPPASLLHPLTPGTLLLPDEFSPKGLLSP